uniref:Chalcone--flavanone isomerase n=1 Tax=Tradescantia hirsutiflora TaxID=428262 RepID=A0A1D8BEL0_9LILI|nr:chalcone-flavanone isomerase CHI3B [Tradescantia hirsutiflora]
MSLWLHLSSFFPHNPPRLNSHAAAAAAALTTVSISGLAAIALRIKSTDKNNTCSQSVMWASLSLSTDSTVDPKTGVSFPDVTKDGRRLMGIGLRKASLLGLKSLDIYAFGVYCDGNGMKELSDKYGAIPVSELQKSREFVGDVRDQDIGITVRLQIVYGRLSIGSVRSAFEKSVGSRLKKFSGSDDKVLLGRFTSMFKDEYKLPKGSVIEISREKGYVLVTKIDGKVVGQVQSKLLCQSVLDLYFGEDPFDRKAKENIQYGLASTLLERAKL